MVYINWQQDVFFRSFKDSMKVFMSTLQQLLQHKIVAILRGVPAKDVLRVAGALYEGGIKALEVTLNSHHALQQIETLQQALGNKLLVGAGTVLDLAGAKAARKAGARFLISPTVDTKVISFAKEHDLVSIPGAYTATEVLLAHDSGGDIIKIFPAPNPAYIKNLLGPLDHIKMMAVGGINEENIRQYQQAGAVSFGVASSLVKTTAVVDENYLKQLTGTAQRLVQAITTQ
jgi:2-dehydro-3-deoxyphosphogluconate aldolase/(4S)-4-hydroxy-2-oxoglutarate aldolase